MPTARRKFNLFIVFSSIVNWLIGRAERFGPDPIAAAGRTSGPDSTRLGPVFERLDTPYRRRVGNIFFNYPLRKIPLKKDRMEDAADLSAAGLFRGDT